MPLSFLRFKEQIEKIKKIVYGIPLFSNLLPCCDFRKCGLVCRRPHSAFLSLDFASHKINMFLWWLVSVKEDSYWLTMSWLRGRVTSVCIPRYPPPTFAWRQLKASQNENEGWSNFEYKAHQACVVIAMATARTSITEAQYVIVSFLSFDDAQVEILLLRDAVYSHLISRVRDNLHIVLCMSPVGEAFRTRCRMFPSLVNCCTIDWFSEWPR